jgi:hypothetical protein
MVITAFSHVQNKKIPLLMVDFSQGVHGVRGGNILILQGSKRSMILGDTFSAVDFNPISTNPVGFQSVKF